MENICHFRQDQKVYAHNAILQQHSPTLKHEGNVGYHNSQTNE